MKGFAATLSDGDMQNIAAWLAKQPAKPGFAKDKDLVALGERIYRGGIADRRCRLRGLPQPQRRRHSGPVPAPVGSACGLHREATESFRDGKRKNSPQMKDVAAKLNDREIKAVADYIAGLR
jgi:cytochrome c553